MRSSCGGMKGRAARINPNDGVRIIRALEVLELTGRSIVEHHESHRFCERPYGTLKIGLALERERLNERIDQRTERMIADGFADEVQGLLRKGYGEELKPMQSLGYRHLVAHLAGKRDLEGTVRMIKRDTRHYARRQMTWFAADPEIRWIARKMSPERTEPSAAFWSWLESAGTVVSLEGSLPWGEAAPCCPVVGPVNFLDIKKG